MEPEKDTQLSKGTFVKEMKKHFSGMKASQRDVLLTELYRLCTYKKFLDWYAPIKRTEVLTNAARFRKFRLWVVRLERELDRAMKPMRKAVVVVNANPTDDNRDGLGTVISREIVIPLTAALNGLDKTAAAITHFQYLLAAEIHPKKRTDAERKLVPEEPSDLKHTALPLSEKIKEIDTEFIESVASVLEKYRTKDGKPIPRREQIIAHIFKFAFSELRTEGSILRQLSPSRRQKH